MKGETPYTTNTPDTSITKALLKRNGSVPIGYFWDPGPEKVLESVTLDLRASVVEHSVESRKTVTEVVHLQRFIRKTCEIYIWTLMRGYQIKIYDLVWELNSTKQGPRTSGLQTEQGRQAANHDS
ncbi:hypothetical protein BC629DRAFT_1446400 [Irpex lacteus]|nr:hypothetical protein BC629DRAFT_1446400 [Irpex lacteus]